MSTLRTMMVMRNPVKITDVIGDRKWRLMSPSARGRWPLRAPTKAKRDAQTIPELKLLVVLRIILINLFLTFSYKWFSCYLARIKIVMTHEKGPRTLTPKDTATADDAITPSGPRTTKYAKLTRRYRKVTRATLM